MMIRNIVGDAIIQSSVILGEIVASDCEVIEKSNEHSENKYTYYRK